MTSTAQAWVSSSERTDDPAARGRGTRRRTVDEDEQLADAGPTDAVRAVERRQARRRGAAGATVVDAQAAKAVQETRGRSGHGRGHHDGLARARENTIDNECERANDRRRRHGARSRGDSDVARVRRRTIKRTSGNAARRADRGAQMIDRSNASNARASPATTARPPHRRSCPCRGGSPCGARPTGRP